MLVPMPCDHPGKKLRQEVLPSLNLTVKECASHLRVSRQSLQAILSEKSNLSMEMALRIGKLTGRGPYYWLHRQHDYDLYQIYNKLQEQLLKIPTLG